MAPLVKCGESWCSDVYHRASCRGCSREAGGRVGCLALLALHASFVSVVSHASAASAVAGGSREVATGKVPISYVSLLGVLLKRWSWGLGVGKVAKTGSECGGV